MSSSNSKLEFVPYDDGNLSHVLSGPSHGQPWGDGWTLEDSHEYILNKNIISEKLKKLPTKHK
jgi:hypothetical protein